MEKPTEMPQPPRMEIVVRFNTLTAEFSLTGCDQNPVVALGMLDYALARIRRFITQGDIAREMQDASRIVTARGPLV